MSQSSKRSEKDESVFKQNEVEKIIALNVMKREGEIKRMTVRK
jgi:hypothetical protein